VREHERERERRSEFKREEKEEKMVACTVETKVKGIGRK